MDRRDPRSLNLHDVVYVRVTEAKGKTPARAELRIRPTVQGAALVLENQTGRILAMAGGFSYPLSQLNRATQAQRQPGSAIKPLVYLAALRKGLQPNTLVMRRADHAAADRRSRGYAREQDYWSPKNYDNGASGVVTLRRALENSQEPRDRASARRRHRARARAEPRPRLRARAGSAGLQECVRYYPFVLGAQPVRLIDLAAFYAAIANEGVRPAPHVIESIERNERQIYQHAPQLIGLDRLGRSRRVLSAEDDAAGRGAARHRDVDAAPGAVSSPARPARPTTRTMPGSSASPTT